MVPAKKRTISIDARMAIDASMTGVVCRREQGVRIGQ